MDNYYGIFKQLRDLELPNSSEMDLYEGYYAQFYEALANHTDYDINFILEHARRAGGDILELACGSGRLLLPLAQAGFSVTGVDLSEDMLALCRRKLAGLPSRLKENVDLRQGNMAEIELGRKFPLIVLSATSITLIPDEEQLTRLFQAVRRHLAAQGQFIFDLSNPAGRNRAELKENGMHMVTFKRTSQKQFILIGEQRDETTHRAIMNFYAETVEGDRTTRYFGSTVKYYYPPEQLLSLAADAGLHMADSKVIRVPGHEDITMFVLEPEESRRRVTM